MSESNSEFPFVSASGKRYKLEERNDITVRIYQGTGVILNHSNGQMISGSVAHRIASAEAAKAMAQKKHAKTRQRIREAIVEVALENGIDASGPADAVAVAVARFFQDVLDGRGPLKYRLEALDWIAKHGDLLPDRRTNDALDALNDGQTAVIPAALLRDLLQLASNAPLLDPVDVASRDL